MLRSAILLPGLCSIRTGPRYVAFMRAVRAATPTSLSPMLARSQGLKALILSLPHAAA